MGKLLIKLLGEARGNATWDFIKKWVWPAMLTILTWIVAWFKNAPMWQIWIAVIIVCLVSYAIAIILYIKNRKVPAEKTNEAVGKIVSGEFPERFASETKPIKITPLPPTLIKQIPSGRYAIDVEICNENPSVSGVKLRIIKVEPPFISYNDSDISSVEFPLLGFADRILHRDQKCRVRLFIASFTGSINLHVQMADKEHWLLFTPQKRDGRPVEHILTLETSAVDVPTHAQKFRLLYKMSHTESPVVMEEIQAFKPDNRFDHQKEKDALRILVSNLQTQFGKAKINFDNSPGDFDELAAFIMDSKRELSLAISNLKPFITNGESLYNLWLEYDREFQSGDNVDRTMRICIVNSVVHNWINNRDKDPFIRIPEYL